MKLKKINRDCFVVVIVFLMGLFPFYQAAQAASPGNPADQNIPYHLEQLIQLARQNNLPIKIADLDRRLAIEEYRDARALPNPEWEYSQGRGNVPGDPDEPGLRKKPKIWAAGLKWSFPNPIHRYYFLESARTDITEAEIQADMNQREVMKNLTIHFYNLRLHNLLKTFLEEKHRLLEEAAKMTRAKVDIGEAKEIDYLRASVAIQENKTELFRMEKNRAYDKSCLRESVNFSIPADFTIAGDFTFIPLDSDFYEKFLMPTLEKAPLIRLKTNRLAGEKAGLQAARFSLIESIDLFGEKGKEIDGEVWRVGLGVTIPLFNRNSAQIRKAKWQKEKAETELLYARVRLTADVQQTLAEIRVLEKEIATFTAAVLKESRENMEMTEKLYREGEVSLLVFLDSQDSFFAVQARYYGAITEWHILKAELDALCSAGR